FADGLRNAGVRAEADLTATPDLARLAARHTRGKRLAEHVSPRLPEELTVMLKISSTAMWPYLVGAIAAGDGDNAEAAGLDGTPPDASEGHYTPAFFTRFLAHMARLSDLRPEGANEPTRVAGQALGEIAAAVYESHLPR
ncbi:MAG TPA: hypothetical protein VHJ17_09515, partial [Thermomonospora sp.]|nr:hypothetical protein [Thermomonospora sp.]